MKKVYPFVWSVGIGSALAWLVLKPENRKTIKNVIRRTKERIRDEEGMRYI